MGSVDEIERIQDVDAADRFVKNAQEKAIKVEETNLDKLRYNEYQVKEFLLHIDSIFHQRINIFLVAESIFIAAIAAGWNSPKPLKLTICVMGIFFSILIYHTLKRLRTGLNWIVERYKILDTTMFYLRYANLGKDDLSSAAVYVNVLPWITTAFWIFLLFFSVLD